MTLKRSGDVEEFRQLRRKAHIDLGRLSPAGASVAATALMAAVTDDSNPLLMRAEAAYSLGKLRPTPAGVADFLLDTISVQSVPGRSSPRRWPHCCSSIRPWTINSSPGPAGPPRWMRCAGKWSSSIGNAARNARSAAGALIPRSAHCTLARDEFLIAGEPTRGKIKAM